MIIDTHCHIDLYSNPYSILKECESKGITVISMTNLPSHFELGFPHFHSLKKIRIALGMHPLMADSHNQEFEKFIKNINNTSYIGEVGLDFSNEGIGTKDIQIETFTKILKLVSGQNKILSIHSRKAEKEVLTLLRKCKISNAIFHWYSGPTLLINEIVESGYYFSINPSMINSKNGQNIISKIPLENILTESDGPFIQLGNKVIKPWDVSEVINFISATKKIKKNEVELLVRNNFLNLIAKIK
ncbi:MAG: Deoxyribonuclease TatD [Bacteroidota bacterium]|jgi:TatD DNase family protein